MNKRISVKILSVILSAAMVLSVFAGISISASAAANPVYWEQVPLVNETILNNGYQGGGGCQWPNGLTISKTDPNFLVFATDVGGVYVTYNGGKQWIPSNVGLNSNGAASPAVDPTNANRVLLVGGNGGAWDVNGLYLSENKGASWTQVLSKRIKAYRNFKHTVAWDPSSYDSTLKGCKIAYWACEPFSGRENGALFKSEDGGKSWKEIATDKYTDGWTEVDSNGWLFIGNKSGLWRSKDGGKNFTCVLSAPNESDIKIQWDRDNLLGITGLDMVNDVIYATRHDGLYVSNNHGDSFNKINATKLPSPVAFQRIEVSPADPNYMVISNNMNDQWNNVNKIFYSHDGGKTWNIESRDNTNAFIPNNDHQDIFAFHPTDRNIIYSIGGDMITKSTDGGATFFWQSSGYSGLMIGAHIGFNPNNPEVLFLTSQDYNGAVSTDYGKTFTYTNVSGEGWGGWTYGAMAITPKTMVTVKRDWDSNYNIMVTTDGGKTYKNPGIKVYGLPTVYNDPKNANTIYCYEYRSIDGGRTWLPMSGCKGVFTCNPSNGDVYGADGKWVVRSSDFGATWEKVVEMPAAIDDLAFDQKRNKVYAACEDKLYASVNGGNPTNLYDKLPKNQSNWFRADTVAVDPVNPDVVYVGGAANTYMSDVSIARSVDGGNSWAGMNRTVRNVTTLAASDSLDGGKEALSIRVNPETRELFVGTCCLGTWKTDSPDSPIQKQEGMPLIAVQGSKKVALKWFEGNTGAKFEVYRSTSAEGQYGKIASVGTATSYTDSGVTGGTTYYYKVKNLNTGNFTKIAYATPTDAAPKYFNVIGQAGYNEISWGSVADTVNIYRSSTKNGSYEKIASGVSGTSYNDNVSGDYWYKISTTANDGAKTEAKPSFTAYSDGSKVPAIVQSFNESFTKADNWTYSGYTFSNGLCANFSGNPSATSKLLCDLADNYKVTFKYSVNKNGDNAWSPGTTVKMDDGSNSYSVYIRKGDGDKAVVNLRKNNSNIGETVYFDNLFSKTFTCVLTKYEDGRISLSVNDGSTTKIIKAEDSTRLGDITFNISSENMFNYMVLSSLKAERIKYAPSVNEPKRSYAAVFSDDFSGSGNWNLSGYSAGGGKLLASYPSSGSATTKQSYTLGSDWQIKFKYLIEKNGDSSWNPATTFTFGTSDNKYQVELKKDNYTANDDTLTVVLKKNGKVLGEKLEMKGHFGVTHLVTLTCDSGYVYLRIDENDDNKAMVIDDASPITAGSFSFACSSMYNSSQITEFSASKVSDETDDSKNVPVVESLDESFTKSDNWTYSGYTFSNGLCANFSGNPSATSKVLCDLSDNYKVTFKYSVNKNGDNNWNPGTTVKLDDGSNSYSVYIRKGDGDKAVVNLRKNNSNIGETVYFDSLFSKTFTLVLTKYEDGRISLSVNDESTTKFIKASDGTRLGDITFNISSENMYNYMVLSSLKAERISYTPSVDEPERNYASVFSDNFSASDNWNLSGYSAGGGKLSASYPSSGSATTKQSYTLGSDWQIKFKYLINQNGDNTWNPCTTFTFGTSDNKYQVELKKDNNTANDDTLTAVLKKNGTVLGQKLEMKGHFGVAHLVTLTCDSGYVYLRIDENDDDKATAANDASPITAGSFSFACSSMYNYSQISEFSASRVSTQSDADQTAANSVISKINAIGTVTLSSESAINTARSAYNGLTSSQKALVSNYGTLTSAESKLAELKSAAEKQAADQTAANSVISKINAIGTVTLSSENAINTARSAYNALTSSQKSLVSNYGTLTSAESKLAELKSAAEKQAADQTAANDAIAKINAIGTVTLSSESAINTARSAYNGLTSSQKSLVSNYGTLTSAESKLAELKAAAEKTEYKPKTVTLVATGEYSNGIPLFKLPDGVQLYVGDKVIVPQAKAQVTCSQHPNASVVMSTVSDGNYAYQQGAQQVLTDHAYTCNSAKTITLRCVALCCTNGYHHGGTGSNTPIITFTVKEAPKTAYVPKTVTLQATGEYSNGIPLFKLPDGVQLYVGDKVIVPQTKVQVTCSQHPNASVVMSTVSDGNYAYQQGAQQVLTDNVYTCNEAKTITLRCVGLNCTDGYHYAGNGSNTAIITFTVKNAQ